ncbi:phytoene desaturase family protein [Yinghuangia soli]|uniref:NAD(P)/FAD-dependent oxidoreductase n=1 Tax=Yinghuangia soli TaxID=2908204 RepID=A0AA41PZK9_9ACTN|nr:NAD(P)/FAD-dependent oxidoreductase [Yinghuangia soli]MCF2528829.1 NAD(P)/FAD-dependent oxidoreductase [Yinghuangia soli]
MTDYDVIVIGAGNAGLSAAATMQRGGRRTLLLERHNVPGGAAHSFVRGRYEFEVSLHQLAGMHGEGPLRAVFDMLDVTRRLEFVIDDDLYRTVVPGVLDVTLPADWQGVIDTLDAHYPGNRAQLTRFMELVRETGVWQLVARSSLHKMQEMTEWLTGLSDVRRYGLKSFQEVLDDFFTDERLKLVLSSYWSYNGRMPSQCPFMDLARLITLYIEFKPYQVVGGSMSMSSAMLDSFLEAGGEVKFNANVTRIITRGGAACGVRLEDGTEVSSRMVISNAPSITTYTKMLEDGVVPDRVLRDLRGRTIGPSATVTYLGLDAPAAELGFLSSTNFIHADLDERATDRSSRTLEPARFLVATCYDVRPTGYAPPGTSQVALASLHYAAPWEAVAPEDYAAAKFAFAQTQLELLKAVAPGVRDVIEEAEVATPITFKRYLSQPGGTIYGFEQDASDSWLFRDEDLKPNVPGLVCISNWTGAGGYNSMIVMAARVCQRILSM